MRNLESGPGLNPETGREQRNTLRHPEAETAERVAIYETPKRHIGHLFETNK